MTSTLMARSHANAKFSPIMYQSMNVNAEIIIIENTKIVAILSASFATLAFCDAVSFTSFIIFASVVSSPVLSALHVMCPCVFTVAHSTLSPSFFTFPLLSPVSDDSSSTARPSTTIPSAGTLSPVRTMKISPIFSSSAFISVSFPFRTTFAFAGMISISSLNACDTFPFVRSSSIFPSPTKVIIIAADSK